MRHVVRYHCGLTVSDASMAYANPKTDVAGIAGVVYLNAVLPHLPTHGN